MNGALRAVAWAALVAAGLVYVAHLALAVRTPDVGVLGGAGPDLGTALGYLGFAIVGALVLSRHPRHLVGWLFSFVGLTYNLVFLVDRVGLNALQGPGGRPPVELLWVGSWAWLVPDVVSTTLLVLLFPDGSPPSPRWRPALAFSIATVVAGATWFMVRPGPLWIPFEEVENPFGVAAFRPGVAALTSLTWVLWVSAAGASVAGLVARFRHARGVERLQVKWFAYGASVLFTLVAVVSVLLAFFGDLVWVSIGAVGVIVPAAVGAVPVCAGIAILRYRLYDIDIVINRTLVYGALTAALAGLYAAVVKLFERAFVAVTGQSSDLTIVLTLFLLAAVFTPMRSLLQSVVDRRFRPAAAAPHATAPLDALRQLAELRDAGVLTPTEFEAKKAELLRRI